MKHPSEEVLEAFGQGRLSGPAADTIGDHLETCVDCRKVVDKAGSQLPEELARHPDYRITRMLGRGGMGVVYLARNTLMDRDEVLKVAHRTLLERPAAADRFLQEIRAAAQLLHINVVRAYAALRVGDLLVFAMEYVPGEDLAKIVKRQGPLPIAHACLYAVQVAQGLQHAHEKGMVHRDIKPSNLILTRDGKKPVVKILDFGLAKMNSEAAARTDLTAPGLMLGTPDYVAPEQAMDAAKADIRADIYSLGCTLYYLLTGAPPFQGSSLVAVVQAHAAQEPRPLGEVRPDAPPELAAVVAKMLAKDPGQRYPTPADVARDLLPFVKSGAVTKKPPRHDSTVVPATAPAPATTPGLPESPDPFQFEEEAPPPRTRAATVANRRQLALLAGGLVLGLVVVWFVAPRLRQGEPPEGTIVLERLPAGTEIDVDGKPVTDSIPGGSDAFEFRAKPGKRKILIKRPGFKPHAREVDVDAGGRAAMEVRLEPLAPPTVVAPLAATIVLESLPDAAEVLLDGKLAAAKRVGDRGELSTTPGKHLLEIRKPGFTPYVTELSPEAGARLQVLVRLEAAVTPAPKDATLVLVQLPPGADVFLDGALEAVKMQGEIGEVLSTRGVHSLRVLKEGFKVLELNVLLEAGSRREIAIRLEPLETTARPAPEPAKTDSAAKLDLASKPFVSLFNHRNLIGWKTHASQPGKWRVENGFLTCSGPGVSHLFTTRDDFTDFYLVVEARITSTGNSGIFFRTSYASLNPKAKFPYGYEAQINSMAKDPNKTGSLIVIPGGCVANVPKNTVQPGTWFSEEVIANGNHFFVKVNGQTLVDYIDQKQHYRSGHIALQHIDVQTIVEFRRIEIKELK